MRATVVFHRALLAASSAVAQQPPTAGRSMSRPSRTPTAAAPPPKGEIVFVGSSTIHRWDVASYFPDLKIINRGIDGTELADAVKYIDRLVLRYEPRLVVVYAGDNDIGGGSSPSRSPWTSSASCGPCTRSFHRPASSTSASSRARSDGCRLTGCGWRTISFARFASGTIASRSSTSTT